MAASNHCRPASPCQRSLLLLLVFVVFDARLGFSDEASSSVSLVRDDKGGESVFRKGVGHFQGE